MRMSNILDYGNGFPYSENKGMMKMKNYSNYNNANAIYYKSNNGYTQNPYCG